MTNRAEQEGKGELPKGLVISPEADTTPAIGEIVTVHESPANRFPNTSEPPTLAEW